MINIIIISVHPPSPCVVCINVYHSSICISNKGFPINKKYTYILYARDTVDVRADTADFVITFLSLVFYIINFSYLFSFISPRHGPVATSAIVPQWLYMDDYFADHYWTSTHDDMNDVHHVQKCPAYLKNENTKKEHVKK